MAQKGRSNRSNWGFSNDRSVMKADMMRVLPAP
jgi:hypothetical protein